MLGRTEARAASVVCDLTTVAIADLQTATGLVAAAAAADEADEVELEDEATAADDRANGHRGPKEKTGADPDADMATVKWEVGRHLQTAFQDNGHKHQRVSPAHVVC